MEHRRQVRVVEVEAVRERAVDQGCLRRGVAFAAADDARCRRASPAVDHFGNAAGETEAVRGEADADGVEDALLDAVDHVGRKVVEGDLVSETGERLRDRRLGGHCEKDTAMGRTGEPVAPANLRGRQMKRNSYTRSAASCSRSRFSRMWMPCSTS